MLTLSNNFTVRLKLGATFYYDLKVNHIVFTSNGIEERITPEVFTGTTDEIIESCLASRSTKLKLAIAPTLGKVFNLVKVYDMISCTMSRLSTNYLREFISSS